MSEIVEFLWARLDEYEAAARAASTEARSVRSGPVDVATGAPESVAITRQDRWVSKGSLGIGEYEAVVDTGTPTRISVSSLPDVPATSVANHIAHHDPARVLRDVEAKRRIVRRYEHRQASYEQYPNQGNINALLALTEVMHDLASVYSDHPAFKDSWRV